MRRQKRASLAIVRDALSFYDIAGYSTLTNIVIVSLNVSFSTFVKKSIVLPSRFLDGHRQ
jgi:hypothetical protein